MADDWVFDSVIGFLSSPHWRLPLETFMDNNCAIFDSDEENKIEYTIIHQKFKELVEGLLEGFLAELDISPIQFANSIDTKPTMGQNAEKMEALLRPLAAADDFLIFKPIMVERNLELEMEVRKMYEAQVPKNPKSMTMITDPDDDEILKVCHEHNNNLLSMLQPGSLAVVLRRISEGKREK
eukprot:m.311035 g.311035  ORF g.311035 m.311035 type:complete len:182 (+) comp16481_c0_seq17:1040-1585(+)